MSAPVATRHQSARARHHEAAIAYADASDTDDTEYSRADDRLAKAAEAFTLSLPKWAHLRALASQTSARTTSAPRRRTVAARRGQLELPLGLSPSAGQLVSTR